MLTEPARTAVEQKAWKISREKHGKLGGVLQYTPDVPDASAVEKRPAASAVRHIPSRIDDYSILAADSGQIENAVRTASN